MPRQKKFKFGLNEKQADLWADKLMDVANLLLTGILLTQGLSKKLNLESVGVAITIYVILGFIATFIRR